MSSSDTVELALDASVRIVANHISSGLKCDQNTYRMHPSFIGVQVCGHHLQQKIGNHGRRILENPGCP